MLPGTAVSPTLAGAPLTSSWPETGSELISIVDRAFGGSSSGSVNPKSDALNVYSVSSLVVTLLFTPSGASLTEVTPIDTVAGAEVSWPSSTLNVKVSVPAKFGSGV